MMLLASKDSASTTPPLTALLFPFQLYLNKSVFTHKIKIVHYQLAQTSHVDMRPNKGDYELTSLPFLTLSHLPTDPKGWHLS